MLASSHHSKLSASRRRCSSRPGVAASLEAELREGVLRELLRLGGERGVVGLLRVLAEAGDEAAGDEERVVRGGALLRRHLLEARHDEVVDQAQEAFALGVTELAPRDDLQAGAQQYRHRRREVVLPHVGLGLDGELNLPAELDELGALFGRRGVGGELLGHVARAGRLEVGNIGIIGCERYRQYLISSIVFHK